MGDTDGQKFFEKLVDAQHRREDQSAEIADLRTRLAQAEAREAELRGLSQDLTTVLEKRNATLFTARAELADESPGTPMGRLNAIGEFAIDRGLCSGVEAKPAELFILEAFDAARAEAEAMREVLDRALAWATDFDINDAWTDDARAALQVHRPHGEEK